jgi:hypothetical protein
VVRLRQHLDVEPHRRCGSRSTRTGPSRSSTAPSTSARAPPPCSFRSRGRGGPGARRLPQHRRRHGSHP